MSLAKTVSLRQLATFQAVARLGSVSLAGDELHISQSAVSLQIASLEDSAGVALMVRTGRGVRLTEAGELLLTYADRMLAMRNELGDDMATFLGVFSGTLRVGAVTTAEYWLPHLLVAFVDENPNVNMKLHVGNRDEIVRSLSALEIDIAVMGQPPDEIKVVATSFAKNPVAFVAAPHHPLMSNPRLSMATLAEARLLVRERGSGSRTTVERLFREADLELRIGPELSSNEAIKQLCVAGYGPAYLSMQACSLELDVGVLAMLPLPDNPVEREWFAVRLASRQLPQVSLAFEQFLRQKGQADLRRQLWQPRLALNRPH